MQTKYEDLVFQTENGIPVSDSNVNTALSSNDPYLQWVGAKAAGLTENPKWIRRLTHLAVKAQEVSEPDLNTIAVWALAKMPTDVVISLYEAWAVSREINSRRAAADLIGEARHLEGAPILATLLDDREDDVAKWAALSLTKLGKSTATILESAARSTDRFTIFVYCLDGLIKLSEGATAQLIANVRKSDFHQKTNNLIVELKKQNADVSV